MVDACHKEKEITNEELTIRLKWNPGFDTEPYSNIETGLLWTLSYLGADLPVGSLSKTIVRLNLPYLELRLYHAGFSDDAKKKLALLLSDMKESAEYQQSGGIDVGRFVMLTLYSSYNYYAITNTERSFDQFEKNFLHTTQLRYAVNNSDVSSHERLITFSPTSTALQMGFIAADGIGSIAQNQFQVETHECWSIMKNGQLKYAVYNSTGKLAGCSTSEAGKPGKCMWCHEIAVQSLYNTNADLAGFLTQQEFSAWISAYQSLLDNYRETRHGEIDYSKTQDHTYAELLYITFMEPSLFRLAAEWNLSETEVLQRLSGISTHSIAEYPWLGNVYHRKEIESHSPFPTIPVSDDPRECSNYEPDYFGINP